MGNLSSYWILYLRVNSSNEDTNLQDSKHNDQNRVPKKNVTVESGAQVGMFSENCT